MKTNSDAVKTGIDCWFQHAAMVALRDGHKTVSVVYDGGESMGTGRVQSVRAKSGDWEVTIGDFYGGAFWFPLTEVKAIRWDGNDQPVLVVVANWQK